MVRPRFPRRARVAVALSAAVAALIIAAVIASAGSAQPPTTLHLVARSQKGVGFFPNHKPHQGDRFGFGDKTSGDDTGTDRGICTVIGKQTLCNVEEELSKGTLSAQGIVPQTPHNTPVAVTGGTGAYNGARGTAIVNQVNNSTTDITITLLP